MVVPVLAGRTAYLLGRIEGDPEETVLEIIFLIGPFESRFHIVDAQIAIDIHPVDFLGHMDIDTGAVERVGDPEPVRIENMIIILRKQCIVFIHIGDII